MITNSACQHNSRDNVVNIRSREKKWIVKVYLRYNYYTQCEKNLHQVYGIINFAFCQFCPNLKYPTWRLHCKTIFVIVPIWKIRYADTNRKKLDQRKTRTTYLQVSF